MYYELEGNKYIIFNHDTDNKSLPINGWIHNCVFCDTITSSHKKFNHNYLSINIIICPDCYKRNLLDINKKLINSWIKSNIKVKRKFNWFKKYKY